MTAVDTFIPSVALDIYERNWRHLNEFRESVDIDFLVSDSERRITFDTPNIDHQVCGIAALTALDLVASKLLANSDRWSDAGEFCRDVIDLGMLQASMKLFCAGIEKAEAAYGDSVGRDLLSAIESLKLNPLLLERSISALGIQVPQALLWQRIMALGKLFERAG